LFVPAPAGDNSRNGDLRYWIPAGTVLPDFGVSRREHRTRLDDAGGLVVVLQWRDHSHSEHGRRILRSPDQSSQLLGELSHQRRRSGAVIEQFFIVGAQRSGTTWLYKMLDQHPEVAMAKPMRPEPKYFLRDDATTRPLAQYEKTYYEKRAGRACGEK